VGTSGKAAPVHMRGAGYYSQNTIGAKAVIDAAAELVLEALSSMPPVAEDRSFAMADFGAADGGTSLDLMRRAIRAIQRVTPHRQISLTYTDLPHNDFSSLFRLLHGLLPGRDADPLAQMPGIFTFATGTSFYRQALPDGALNFGFSATAMHWLSHLPVTIADHVHAVGADTREKAKFRQAAQADWERILLMRARELAPGGKLVLANFCEDEQGHYLGHTGGANMHDTFAEHWRGLHRSGRISDAEYRAGTFMQFYKTVEDFTAPFADAGSPVRQAGLSLDKVFTRTTGCPYAAKFRAENGDPAAFAAAYLPTLRSWSESTFFGALSPGRPLEERRDIIDAFYAAYQDGVAAAPDRHGMDYVHCFMVISKAG
jgi:indole-3-acetate O-methyltransferase